jgi:hypothetical protein
MRSCALGSLACGQEVGVGRGAAGTRASRGGEERGLRAEEEVSEAEEKEYDWVGKAQRKDGFRGG